MSIFCSISRNGTFWGYKEREIPWVSLDSIHAEYYIIQTSDTREPRVRMNNRYLNLHPCKTAHSLKTQIHRHHCLEGQLRSRGIRTYLVGPFIWVKRQFFCAFVENWGWMRRGGSEEVRWKSAANLFARSATIIITSNNAPQTPTRNPWSDSSRTWYRRPILLPAHQQISGPPHPRIRRTSVQRRSRRRECPG